MSNDESWLWRIERVTHSILSLDMAGESTRVNELLMGNEWLFKLQIILLLYVSNSVIISTYTKIYTHGRD